MSFVFTERIVNIVPAHRVYSEEFMTASTDQANSQSSRKLTRKTKVLTVDPVINKSKSAHGNASKQYAKEGQKRTTMDDGRTVRINHGLLTPDKNDFAKKMSGRNRNVVKPGTNRIGTGLQFSTRHTSPETMSMGEVDGLLVGEDEVIRSKLLAEKEKEKSLMIQKYIQDGKKKRLANLRAEKERREAQKLELQKKLNALNEYRKSKFKVISPQKIKEASEARNRGDREGDAGSRGDISSEILDQSWKASINKVEYETHMSQDYNNSAIERVSNISEIESSSVASDSTNQRVYKTLMVNIEMIKERIEQLANQTGSRSSASDAGDMESLSTSVAKRDDESNNLIAEPLQSSITPEIDDEDILDEPHISFLIKEVESKSVIGIPQILENESSPVVENDLIPQNILTKEEIQEIDLLQNTTKEDSFLEAGPNKNADRKSATVKHTVEPVWSENADRKSATVKHTVEPVWSDLNADESILFSEYLNSKDLADESMLFEKEQESLLKELSDIDSEQIGVGSLCEFTRNAKVSLNEGQLFGTCDSGSFEKYNDGQAANYTLLAKTLLSQTTKGAERARSSSLNDNFDNVVSNSNLGNDNDDKIQLSRKRRISATDVSFEVVPKKVNILSGEQWRVLDIFQKKFIARRHGPKSLNESQSTENQELVSERNNVAIIGAQEKISDLELAASSGLPNNLNVNVNREESANVLDNNSMLSEYDTNGTSMSSVNRYSDTPAPSPAVAAESQQKPINVKNSSYDESANVSSSSTNSSFSEKSSKGHIGVSWRPDSKRRLMDPRYRLSTRSLLEKYDAEVSLSEVIDLSLSQVDSMVQGRKIALAQEEALNLRNMMQNRVKGHTCDNIHKQEQNVHSTNMEREEDKNYNYDSSFESISTESNIKCESSILGSSISFEYGIKLDRKSAKLGNFTKPLMSETTTFRILSENSLLELPIKEILDYKEKAKLFFQQEFVWLNMRERAIDFRYSKEQEFYEHERKRLGKKDKQREKLILENEQAIEMKLVADKEDISRQRQKIRDKMEERIENVLKQLSNAVIAQKENRRNNERDRIIAEENMQPSDLVEVSVKVNNILGMSKPVASIEKNLSNYEIPIKNYNDYDLVKKLLNSTQSMTKKEIEGKLDGILSDEIVEDIVEENDDKFGAQQDVSAQYIYENDQFDSISEISNDLKNSKESILDLLRGSPITTEVLKAAEKIKKLNEENEKRKIWIAETMKKQESRLKEESKILDKAVDNLSRYITENDTSNDMLRSALNVVDPTAKLLGAIDSKTARNRTPSISEFDESIREEIPEEFLAKELPQPEEKSTNYDSSEIHAVTIVASHEANHRPPLVAPEKPLDQKEVDIAEIEAQYMEDFEVIEEIIEEMVEISDYNQQLMDEEIVSKLDDDKEELSDDANISRHSDIEQVGQSRLNEFDYKEELSDDADISRHSDIEQVGQSRSNEALNKNDSTISRVDLITDMVWTSLLLEIDETIKAVSSLKESSIMVDEPKSGILKISTKKGIDEFKPCSDPWMLSDEMPIELVKQLIMKILDSSISSDKTYNSPMLLQQTVINSIVPSKASMRRREESFMIFDLTVESLEHIFACHLKYHENSHSYLKPKELTKDVIIQKSLDYSLNCWTYSHENGENLDALLIKEVKDEEKTWIEMEKSMNIDLKERISHFILEELITDTTQAISQLYKDVF